MSLEDMAIILFETEGFLESSAARRRRRRRRGRYGHQRSRLNERRSSRRNAGVGAPIQEEVGFVGRPYPIGRGLQVASPHGFDQTRRDDDDEFGLVVLESVRAKQCSDNRDRAEERNLTDRVLEVLSDQARHRETLTITHFD